MKSGLPCQSNRRRSRELTHPPERAEWMLAERAHGAQRLALTSFPWSGTMPFDCRIETWVQGPSGAPLWGTGRKSSR